MSNDKRAPDPDVDRGRRGFFRALAAQAMSAAEELRGKPQFRLDDIDSLPDDVIAALVPVWHRQGPVRLVGNRLVRLGTDGAPQTLLDLGPEQMRLLSLFDGFRNVGQIANAWTAETGLSEPQARVDARRLFVLLAKLMVMVPAEPPLRIAAAVADRSDG
jgi:hypothetical protein